MTDLVVTQHRETVIATDVVAATCATALDAAVAARLLALKNAPPVGLTGAIMPGTYTYYFDGTNYQGYTVISYATAA